MNFCCRSFFAKEEVRTKKEYGAKRADGLLVFRHWLWGQYVVSMEAKSYKTMPALKPRLDPYKLMWNSLKVGGAICLLSVFRPDVSLSNLCIISVSALVSLCDQSVDFQFIWRVCH